jgi:hypothetical protein
MKKKHLEKLEKQLTSLHKDLTKTLAFLKDSIDGGKAELNPQPLPPKKNKANSNINPQPLPPQKKPKSAINPQPLPPQQKKK